MKHRKSNFGFSTRTQSYLYIRKLFIYLYKIWLIFKRFAGIFRAVEFLLHYFQSTVIRFVACFIIYNTKPKPTKTKLGTYIPIDFFYREILICFKHYKNSLKLDSVPFSFNEIRQSNFKKCISVAFLCDFSIFYQSCGN